MSITYNDLLRTNYPDFYDDRPTAIDPNNRNPHFEINVNFEDRTPTTEPQKYYVLANDINSLQESIIAVQRTLGLKPQGPIADSISGRFETIEAYILLKANGFLTIDERLMWGGPKPQGASLISIAHHLHDGTVGQADKIDLSRHVTGLLPRQNIDVTSGTSAMLTAETIYTSTGKSKTINGALGEKLDKLTTNSQIVSGPVRFNNNMSSRMFVDLDAKDLPGMDTSAGYSNVSDSEAYSGVARRALNSNVAGRLMARFSMEGLRYWNYSVGIRLKVSSINKSLGKVCVFALGNGVSSEGIDIYPSDFDAAYEWQEIFFDYKFKRGSFTGAPLFCDIWYHGGADLYIDSIVVMPIHTAVYDK